MDPAYLDYLLFAAAGFALTMLGFATAWVRARERAIRAEQRTADMLASGAQARFDRLERLAEDVALEVERLGEAQRFQGKLLADRADSAAPHVPPSTARPPRVDTPH
jgi:hypothetical protein